MHRERERERQIDRCVYDIYFVSFFFFFLSRKGVHTRAHPERPFLPIQTAPALGRPSRFTHTHTHNHFYAIHVSLSVSKLRV